MPLGTAFPDAAHPVSDRKMLGVVEQFLDRIVTRSVSACATTRPSNSSSAGWRISASPNSTTSTSGISDLARWVLLRYLTLGLVAVTLAMMAAGSCSGRWPAAMAGWDALDAARIWSSASQPKFLPVQVGTHRG